MEEERTLNPVPDNINQGDENYESALFDASGYTWKLVFYPNGNAKRGGGGHISLYLAIEKTDSLPLGWEAYVTYKMFVYNHKEDKYLTIQDDPAVQQIRRFHQAKKECGFDRLISLETFNAATNGYLVDDSCVFGVEVYKVKNSGNGETVKILEDPTEFTFDRKVSEFSKICKEKLNCQRLESEEFTGGECKWRLRLYPNGAFRTKDYLSLFLELLDSPTSVKKVSAEFSFVIKNQLSDCHHKRAGVVRYLRDAPPAHYSVKIESFSKLVNAGDEKYESALFDASGYTWKLVLYPNGNAKRGGGGHISLYLAVEKTDSLPLGWEAYVTYKMFVYNHNKDKYLTIQDDPAVQQIRRFHQAKKECGFDRLISLETFNAATNGYLVDDSCVFGVEVYKVKNSGNGETVKILEDPTEFTFDWKVSEFSKICKEKLNGQRLESEEFTVGECKWHLLLYPSGDKRKDYLSLYLQLVESPKSGKKVSAGYSLVIKNQKSDRHHKHTSNEAWFSTDTTKFTDCGCSVTRGWGLTNFMLLSDLTRESSGFIVNDTILIQAKVKIKTEVTSFF